VIVATFGDGSTSIGATHEAMNLASLWNLPTIFLCQNNGFGEHTPYAQYTRTEMLSSRAAGYGMPGVTVDGGSVPELHEALTAAIDRARDGLGPTFIEARTRRVMGHTFGAAQPYRTKEDIDRAGAAEPIAPYRQWLIDRRFAENEWLAATDAAAADTAEKAVEFAKNSPFTPESERLTDVFATSVRV
jgi:TPP-dependent pyruvate/acetoin dehydrogenase alpha subunit